MAEFKCPTPGSRMAFCRVAALVVAILVPTVPTRATAEPEDTASDRWGGVDFMFGGVSNSFGSLRLIGLKFRGGMMINPAMGFGAELPLAHARAENFDGTGIGNLTGHFYYVMLRQDGEFRSRAWLRASVSLPTASDSGEGGVAAAAHTVFWIPDAGLYHPDASTVRVGGNYAASDGFKSVEASFEAQHLFIDGPAGDLTRALFRVGGGLRLGRRIGAFGAFSTVWSADSPPDEDNFLHVLDVGLVLATQGGGNLRLFVYLPLDETYRDTLEAFGFGLSFGSGF